MRYVPVVHVLTSPLRNQRGATLMVVLAVVVATGLAAGIAGSSWQTIMQRAREAELLWRGDQYRKAIESYYTSAQGGVRAQYPTRLDDLLQDPRFPGVRRHIRRLYKDPLTGGDFELIRAGGEVTGLPGTERQAGGIRGVRSTSTKEPFRKQGFEKPYESFSGAQAYRGWEFVYVPARAPRPAPGKAVPNPSSPPAGDPASRNPGETGFNQEGGDINGGGPPPFPGSGDTR